MAIRKKRKNKASKGPSKFSKLKAFFQDKTVHATFGVVLIFAGLFMLFSIISFLGTWKHDQSLLQQTIEVSEVAPLMDYDNVLGKMGARLGNQLAYNWFGLNSIILAFFVIIIGLKVGFKLNLIATGKMFRNGIFWIIWLSIFLGLIQIGTYTVYKGGIGFFTSSYLANLLGTVGSWLLLSFSLLAYLIITFKWTPESLSQSLSFLKQEKSIKTPVVENENLEVIEEPEPEVIDLTQGLKVEEKISVNPQVKEERKELEIELSSEPKQEIQKEEEPKIEIELEKIEEEVKVPKKEINKLVKEFGEYDPTLELSKFQLPPLELLEQYGDPNIKIDQTELEENKNKIVETLANYNIEISKIKATIGPTVTLYEIIPVAGVRISKIKNLEDDIALSLAALGIRIIAPIPGKGTIGIEVPNANPKMVAMRTVLQSEKFQHSKMELPVALGKTISNETFVFDLTKMPHLLMAGATGQGKSVGLNAILASLLYKKHPSQVKFILVDPKKVELTLFNKIERHYLAKLPDESEAIITDTSKVVNTLNSLCIEMDNRYELLKTAMVRNLKEYNAKFVQRKLNPEEGHKYLPYIVLVIDEFADLIMTAGKEVETPIARLAQLARAIGIHLIVATQRPSVNVITGIIKANFPARVAFRVTSKIDSRTILDAGGADQLIGKGDMLYTSGNELVRLQCAFIDTPEVERITDFIGSQKAYPEAYLLPEYIGEEGGGIGDIDKSDRDVLFADAARIIVIHQQGSASLLQRKLKLGYNRAGRIVDQLEAAGIIGQFEGSKARQVLVPDEMALEQLLNKE
jgi:DNA segregation ATPase FtsK/SpoIIIE, S-DNA-T family